MAKTDLTPLVIRAQAGDRSAMNDLLGSCYEDLYYYAYKTVQNEDLAADVTQESCMEILTTLEKLREPGAFSVWARRIVYHQCTRYFRQTREVTLGETEDGESIFDQLPDEREGSLPEQIQEDKEFRELMQQMLNQLPTHQRTALLLYYYERFSVSQIAVIQEVSEGTVKSRLNYGRKAVKASVEEYEKKTGVRLYSAAPFAWLLAFLFRWEKESHCRAAAGALEALGNNLSKAALGGKAAAGVGGKAAAAVGAGAAKSLALKIVAGVAALAITAGAAVGITVAVKNASEGSQTETEEEKKDNALAVEALAHLVGPWYGEWYDEEIGEDLIVLQEDGSVLVHGHPLTPVGIEKLEGEYSCAFGEFYLDGPSYQLLLKSDPQMTEADVTVSFLCMDSRENRYIAFAWAEAEDGTCPVQAGFYYQEPPAHQEDPEEKDTLQLIQPFVGEWICANLDGTDDITFRLGEDGSVEFDGQIYYFFDAQQEEHESYSEYEIDTILTRIDVRDTVEEECQKALIIEIFQNVNGMYAAEVSALTVGEYNDLYMQGGTFFRRDDLEGMEKIAITEENFQTYVYADPTYHAVFDQETQQWYAESRLTVGFYWEFMAPACFKGDITYTVQEYTLRYDAVNKRELSKEPIGTRTETWEGYGLAGTLFFFGEVSVWENGEFHSYDDFRISKEATVDENGIVTYTVWEIVSLRVENVRGYVYVPKS